MTTCIAGSTMVVNLMPGRMAASGAHNPSQGYKGAGWAVALHEFEHQAAHWIRRSMARRGISSLRPCVPPSTLRVTAAFIASSDAARNNWASRVRMEGSRLAYVLERAGQPRPGDRQARLAGARARYHAPGRRLNRAGNPRCLRARRNPDKLACRLPRATRPQVAQAAPRRGRAFGLATGSMSA